MLTKILDPKNLVPDFGNQKIFFGSFGGFQRYDQYRYPFAKSIEEKIIFSDLLIDKNPLEHQGPFFSI